MIVYLMLFDKLQIHKRTKIRKTCIS